MSNKDLDFIEDVLHEADRLIDIEKANRKLEQAHIKALTDRVSRLEAEYARLGAEIIQLKTILFNQE